MEFSDSYPRVQDDLVSNFLRLIKSFNEKLTKEGKRIEIGGGTGHERFGWYKVRDLAEDNGTQRRISLGYLLFSTRGEIVERYVE